MQLICTFRFTYVKSRFSHEAADFGVITAYFKDIQAEEIRCVFDDN